MLIKLGMEGRGGEGKERERGKHTRENNHTSSDEEAVPHQELVTYILIISINNDDENHDVRNNICQLKCKRDHQNECTFH